MNGTEIKRNIFYLFDIYRILFNKYYNGHDENFTAEEIEKIKEELQKAEELKKELNYIIEFYDGNIPF